MSQVLSKATWQTVGGRVDAAVRCGTERLPWLCGCSGFVKGASGRQVTKKNTEIFAHEAQDCWERQKCCCGLYVCAFFNIFFFFLKKWRLILQTKEEKWSFPLCHRRLLSLRRPSGRFRSSAGTCKLLRCMLISAHNADRMYWMGEGLFAED